MQNDNQEDALEGEGREMNPEEDNPFNNSDEPSSEISSTSTEGDRIPPEPTEPHPVIPVSRESNEIEDDTTFFDSLSEGTSAAGGEDPDALRAPPDHPGDQEAAGSETILDQPFSGQLTEAEIKATFGEAEAVLSSDAESRSLFLEDESLFTSLSESQQPPEGFPDRGMGTVSEEITMMDEMPPEMEDGGMSAGHPPMRDEDFPPEPAASIARPDPAAMSGAPLFSAESFQPPGPSPARDESAPSISGEKPANPEMLDLLITEDDLKDLWRRANEAQKKVIENIATKSLGQKMLNYLQNSKNELLSGKENYEEAERFINEVEYQVSFSVHLRSISKWFTTGLFIYEVGWATAMILFLIFGIGVSAAFASSKMEGTPDQTYLLTSMVWGGFGGVIGALLALTKHIAIEQDFDRQHTWWYFTSPPMGIGMGAVVYLFLHVGLFSIVGADADIASPLVIYVFAWLAGYQQNVFTDLVKRMMKTLMGQDIKTDRGPEVKPNFEVTPEDQTG